MIEYFARHPTAANLLMVVLVAMGAFSVSRLRRATFPDYLPTEIQVTYLYPGATAEEVEEAICRRVENAMDSVRHVAEIRSDAGEGVAVITIKMEELGNAADFKDEIQTSLDGITGLPQEVQDPITKELGTTELVLNLLVGGPMEARDLKAYAEDLKSRIQRLPQVASVTISGFSDHQFRVELSAEALMRYDLDVSSVAQMLERQNLNLAAGSIKSAQRELVVRMVEQRRSVSELQDIVILAAGSGAEVRLGDIAKISDTFEQAEDQIRLRGMRAAKLSVEKTRDQDTIRVADTVKEFIEAESARMPEAMEYLITLDMAPLISGRLDLLYKFFWQGALLVFLVMWLFFNAKLSFWVVMSIPVSVAGALFVMPILGLTIDMFSMVAILMALGILMDDGIVIAENVAEHVTRGSPAWKAAVDGVSEVRSGVLASFLTTTCVLGPLIFVSGEMGRVIRVVPIVLLIVLIFSLIEAFLILPSHLRHSLDISAGQQPGAFRRRFDSGIDWVRDVLFGRTIKSLIQFRYLWVGIAACIFLVSVAMIPAGVLKYQGFPTPDGNWLEARLAMQPGTSLEQTQKTVERITDALQRVDDDFSLTQPDGQRLLRSYYVVFNQNLDTQETGSHVATVAADLLDAEERTYRLNDVKERWSAETGQLADVSNLSFTEPAIAPSGRSIEVRLQAEDLDYLAAAADEVHQWFLQWSGVRNLTTDLRHGKEELQARLRDGAVGLGLDASEVARQLRSAFQGVTASEVQVGDETYDIDVMLRSADQNTPSDLDNHHIKLADGSQSPLSTVVEFDRERGWSRISRVNGRRTATVLGDTDARFIKTNLLFSKFRQDFLPTFQAQHPDISVTIEGEIKKIDETQDSIAWAGLIGVLGIFVLLSLQFRSYIEPLVVMVAIPMSFIGVIFGHLLLGYDLTLHAVFAFVSLAGIVINDSILLVLYLKNRVEEGECVVEAAAEASRRRFARSCSLR